MQNTHLPSAHRPHGLPRRQWMGALAAACASAWLGPLHAQPAAAQGRALRVLLNTSLSGPVAFFLLAQERGYLRQQGLEVQWSGGPGAAAMVPLVRDGAYELGYGDISALIERIAHSAPGTGPVAIFTTFNTVPFTIAVDARGPIRTPQDLIGRRVTGHSSDAALLTFDLYAQAAGIGTAGFTAMLAASPAPLPDAAGVEHPVDRFILARLAERKIAPSAKADRRTLIRRVYFDLHGLPPSGCGQPW